jgi:peptidoglycan/xylan/chitin deacetylase (PgdA/CDA1 family)
MTFKRFLWIGIPLWFVTAALVYLALLPFGLLLSISLLFMFILFRGIFHLRSNFFIRGFHHFATQQPYIALTFDDGPHPEYTPQVLALLRQFQMKATFFCIGRQMEKHPQLVQNIIAEGHAIGNHTYSHLPTIDWKLSAGWKKEIEKTDRLIQSHTGVAPNLFRPPYGITTPHLANALQDHHHLIGWSQRTLDTQKQNSNLLVQKIIEKLKPGDIILLHDTHAGIVPILEQLLPYLQEYGWHSLALTTVLQNDKSIGLDAQ